MRIHNISEIKVEMIKLQCFYQEKATKVYNCYLSQLFRCKSILDELQTRSELLAQIIKTKMAFYGHACINNKCKVKTCICIIGMDKEEGGAPGYIDNIKKWTKASLEENVRLTKDRTSWLKRRCAAGAAN